MLSPVARTSHQSKYSYHLLCRECGTNTYSEPTWPHSISYSQVEEIDTALCLQKLALSGCKVALPRNIQPSVFTTLAWDNIDRLEETISGEGTSHRVNGIAIQAKVIGPQPLKIAPSISKKKKRSIDTAALMLPTYNPGQ